LETSRASLLASQKGLAPPVVVDPRCASILFALAAASALLASLLAAAAPPHFHVGAMAAAPPWTPAAEAEAAARAYLARTHSRVAVRADLSADGAARGFVALPASGGGAADAVIYALNRGDRDLRVSVGAARVDLARAFAGAEAGAEAVPLPGLRFVAVDMLPCPGLTSRGEDGSGSGGAGEEGAGAGAGAGTDADAIAGAGPGEVAGAGEGGGAQLLRGWTVLARTPTSSLPASAPGVRALLLRDGRLRLELRTRAFALAGAVRPQLLAAAGVHHMADAAAPAGSWFQVRGEIALELDITACVAD